jgi:hypothetical protein
MCNRLENESVELWLARELHNKKLTDRYWRDPEFRKSKNEDNKNRARAIVFCVSCKTKYTYGSLGPHKKICKGFVEPTTLELLTKTFEQMCL